jgi:dihydrofolate reductase
MDRKGCIGKNGTLPFKSDLDFFKRITTGHTVIMGRKTWDSLKVQPLPDRINIIVSTSLPAGRWFKDKVNRVPFYSVKSIGSALGLADELDAGRERFLIGGAQLYASAFIAGVVDSVLLTRFGLVVEDGDCYFPRSINQLEQSFKRWKTFQIDNDGETPLMRTFYTNEL